MSYSQRRYETEATGEPITITVAALPPTVNHMYVTCKGGRRALGPQAEVFRALVLEQVTEARPAVPCGPLALTVRLWFGDRRKADIDNRLKAAIDALALALHFDDSRIHEIHAVRVGCDPGRPRCELVLSGVR